MTKIGIAIMINIIEYHFINYIQDKEEGGE
jgi:hypothetical protein